MATNSNSRLWLSGPRAGRETTKDGARRVKQAGDLVARAEGENAPDTPPGGVVVPMENLQPMRRRVVNPTRGLFRKLSKRLRARLYPEMTEEQRAALAEKEARKKLHQVLLADAKTAEKRMINRLTDMGLCYEYRKKDGGLSRYAKVKFDSIRFEPNALWFHVDISHLPHGVSTEDLKTKEVLDNLGMAVGHAVTLSWSMEKGIWYCVERASGAMGIPNHVNLEDLWKRIPASKDSLTIPVGLTNNSRPVFESITSMPHFLLAGSTNSGKSNMLNVILCTLLRRNAPEQLQMLLVDLKGGMEFKLFEGIPHLIKIPEAPQGIIYDREKVLPMLQWLIREGERRMEMMTLAKAKNIGVYNAHHRKNKLPHILVIVDEWADVMYGTKKKETEGAMVNIVQRMRAVGIHAGICTQVPKSAVLDSLVVTNLPAKFAFNTATLRGSMSILDNGHAHNLQPTGRCIYQFRNEILVQTPFIPDNLVYETVEGVTTGKFIETTHRHDVTDTEVMTWAIENNNGQLQGKTLYTAFKDRGLSRDELAEWLESWEGKEFVIGSTLYRVEPGAGTIPRRLVVADQQHGEQQE